MKQSLKAKKWRKWERPFFQELITYFPVFSNFKLTVIIAEDVNKAATYISDREFISEPKQTEGTEALTASNAVKGYAIIYVKPDAPAGTIAHESYHAVCAVMKMAGAEEEHEVVAYHLGYVVDLVAAFQKKVASRFKGEKNGKSRKSN